MKMPLPASGGLIVKPGVKMCIRFAYHGCTNRQFFHIVVMPLKSKRQTLVVEQLGTYDPFVNIHGEKVCSLNLDRIGHWIAMKAQISEPVAVLLGLSGFLPLHPRSYMLAWRKRKADVQKINKNTSGETSQTFTQESAVPSTNV